MTDDAGSGQDRTRVPRSGGEHGHEHAVLARHVGEGEGGLTWQRHRRLDQKGAILYCVKRNARWSAVVRVAVTMVVNVSSESREKKRLKRRDRRLTRGLGYTV